MMGTRSRVLIMLLAALLVMPLELRAEGHGEGGGGDNPYLAIDAVIVNLVGRKHYLRVDVQLKADQPASMEKLKRYIPLFRDQLIIVLSNRDPDSLATPDDREHIRREALEAMKKALKQTTGSGKALKDVYFTDFLMQ